LAVDLSTPYTGDHLGSSLLQNNRTDNKNDVTVFQHTALQSVQILDVTDTNGDYFAKVVL
jgi:hypothetical protein